MMAVLSRVPHCRPQLLPVELGTDMQHGQSNVHVCTAGGVPWRCFQHTVGIHHGPQGRSLSLPVERHTHRYPLSVPFNREAHPVPCARAAVGPQRTEQEMNVLSGFCFTILKLINTQ